MGNIDTSKQIPLEQLKDSYVYKIHARNAEYGIWLAKNKSFLISRFKFGDNYWWEELHWDSSDMGTAFALEELGKAPDSIKDSEGLFVSNLTLAYLNGLSPIEEIFGKNKYIWKD